MSIVTTGYLVLEDGKPRSIQISEDGAVRYSITGGETHYNEEDFGRPWRYRRWTLSISKSGRRARIGYRTGMGIPRIPTAAEILESAFRDAQDAQDAGDFESFADEFGYDPDSRSAFRIYEACQAQGVKLHRVFGYSFDEWRAALLYGNEA